MHIILMWIEQILFYSEIEIHKYVVTSKLQGRMEKLHYICDRKSNRPVIYRNNIYGTFVNKICTTKSPELIPILSNKNPQC